MSYIGYTTAASAQNTTINAVAGVSEGDALVLVRMAYPGGAMGAITPPSGFSAATTYNPDLTGSSVSGYSDRLDVMTKTATASEPATYTVSSANAGDNECYLFAFSGRDAASIALAFTDYVADLTGINASASFDVSGYTAAAGDDVLALGFASTETQAMLSSGGGFTPPSGYTEAFEDIGWRIGHTAAYRENLTAGATGALTFGLDIPTAESVAPYGLRIVMPAAAASNSAPVVNDQTFSVADSASNGTVIGTLIATDSDGTVDSYAISGSTLAINSTTGQITLNDNSGIVAGTPITATATVTDNDGDTDTATVTVNVTNSGLSFSCYDADSSNAAITSETLSHVRVLDPSDLSEVATATGIATSSTGSAEIDVDSVTIGTDYLVIARRSNGDVCEPFLVTASDLAAS